MVARYILLLVSFVVLVSTSMGYAEEGVTIEVEPATGSIYDTFVMIVDVDWEFSSGKVDLKPSPNFEVLGKGRNVNVDLSGGKISQNIQHKFVLKPLREGILETPTVRIWPRRGTFREVKGKSVRVKEGPVANDPLTTNLRFTQSVDTLDVFQGQQLLNTIELERTINLDNLAIETPIYSNAWVESLEQNNVRARHDREGNRRIVHTVSNVLYPTKSGSMVLPRRSMTAMAVLPNQRTGTTRGHPLSPFGRGGAFGGIDFFGSRYRRQPVQMNTNDLEITVHPLPQAPDDFSSWDSPIPIVGDTSIELSYDSRPVKVGESRTLIFKIRSEGNIAPLKTVPLPTLNGVKLYEESPERKTHHDGGKMIMTSTIPLTLVPISTQSIQIPAMSLGFFDPESKTYKQATTNPIQISVVGAPATTPSQQLTNPAVSPPSMKEGLDKADSVDPLPTPSGEPALPTYEEQSWLGDLFARYSFSFFLYWILVILLIVALGSLTFWYSRKTSRKRSLRHRLRQAQEPEELRSVYLDCVGYNLGSVPGDADSLKQSLEKTTLSTDVKFELLTLYDELSFLCFAGADTDSERLLGARERIEAITHRL